MNSKKIIIDSINEGLKFLEKSVESDGFWRTFQSSQGESDIWVSSYILNEIGSILPSKKIKLSLIKSLLDNQSPDGGWGYKRGYVTDADSTATVSLALNQFGDQFFPIVAKKKAAQFLINHLDTWKTVTACFTVK